MKLSNEQIKNLFSELVSHRNEDEEIEQKEKLILAKFLSEIEKIMEEEGVNKKALASRIGKSASYITQIFRGDKVPNFEFIARIEKAFNINFNISIDKVEEKLSFHESLEDDLFEKTATKKNTSTETKVIPLYSSFRTMSAEESSKEVLETLTA